jgi:hypothetical protein
MINRRPSRRSGVCLTLATAFLLGVSTTAFAGPQDDLRADLLSVEAGGGVAQATLEYNVLDFPPFGNVENYFILVGIDRTGDNIIDEVLFNNIPGATGPGPHQWTQDIAPNLDALSPANRIKNGDKLVAQLDWTNQVNELFGAGEGNNVAVATPFYVDIVAKSLVLDGTNLATLTYLVDSPAKIHGFRIEFYLDDNPQNGAWDPTDSTIASVNVNGNTGIRTETADFSSNPPATGQMIFARVDTDGEVAEDKENNNRASFTNAAGADLVAVSLDYDTATHNATLSYYVDSADNVGPYNIEFILDADNDLAPSAGDVVVGTMPGIVTPGPHAAGPFSFAGNPPASGQLIFAYIDRPGAGGNPPITGLVDETDETVNNLVGASNIFTTDLAALSLTYDSNTQNATLAYSIISPSPVAPFEIKFFLDRNNNTILDGGDLPQVGSSVILGGSPGGHVLTQSYAGSAPASNQRIFAVLDFTGAIAESNEANNTAIGINTDPTDLVAVSLAYDSNTKQATLSYAVQAPIPVPAYNIEFVLDADLSGTPTVGDALIATVPGQTAPGAYALSQSYLANPPASGQFIFALIDRLPGPNGTVAESVEVANNRVATANTATTDLVALSLTYDSNTQDATLSYIVQSPIPVAPYFIRFLRDADNSGTITGGDPVVAVVNGSTTPGGYVQTANFAGSPPTSGQLVFAQVDHTAAVTEANEGNNVVSAANTATTDLIANLFGSLTYDSNTQTATLTYEVDSPANVTAYSILFLKDSDNNFFPSFGDTIVGIQAGNVTPGLHSTLQAFAGPNAPASGQAIFAVLDFPPPFGGNVLETDEFNNTAATINTATTDLQALSLTYDSNTKLATLDYVIFSSGNVAGNAIQFYLETNGTPGLQIGVGGDQIIAVLPGSLTPGGHTAVASYLLAQPSTGQFLYATVDTANQVPEADEGNNLATAINLAPTDLVAISLAFDSNTKLATLSYSVNSPANVPAYNIEFFLDRNNTGILDVGDGPRVAIMPGQVAPGAYTAVANYGGAGDIPASGQFLFAMLDRLPAPNGTVPETDNLTNNVASSSNTQATDLVANSVQVFTDDPADQTTARVAYTIYGPLPVAPFSLKVGIDRDANGTIDGGGSDVLADILVNNVVDRSPGAHLFDIPDFRPALNALPFLSRIQQGSQIVATLDLNQDGSPAGAVTETTEQANNKTATTPTVDLVANAVSVVTDASAGTTKANIAYTVDSPGAVEKFKIRVGVDRNNDGVIDSPSDVLDVINVNGNKLKPGPKSITSADIRAALNALSPALQQGDRIIATLDLRQNNTPENEVDELEENTNNVTSQTQKVDLVANAIAVETDVLAGTTEAVVTYTVNSPGATAAFNLRIGVDRNGDGKIDNPDGLLATQLLSGADVTPGPHTLTVTGLRTALNGLATRIKDGDAILATLDLVLAGTDEGAVDEDIETANNSIGQTQTVDLVANSAAISSDDAAGTTTAAVSYTVNSPGNVAPFNIRLGVDRDGDNVVDAAGDVLATIAAPDLTPGTHTLTSGNLRATLEGLATRLKNGDRIIATLDLLQDGSPANNVGEAEEVTNNVAGQTQTVDLVATQVSLYAAPGGQMHARVTYTVNSPATVGTFKVRIGLDTNGDDVLDPGSVLRLYDVQPDLGVSSLRPGAHEITTNDLTADLNALALQDGYRIIATLDLAAVAPYDLGAENSVVEAEEILNNHVQQPLAVDLVAVSLAYDSNTNLATLSYFVDSPGGVPAYDVNFYIDDNPENGLLDGTDTLVATVPGILLPGAHTAVGNYGTTQVNSSQFIFAVLDPAGAVSESNESNNQAATNNTEITDLVANAVTLISDDVVNTTTATVAYSIIAPDPLAVPPFNILVGVDRDANSAIDSPADVLATIAAPDLTPGAHSVTSADLRPALEALATRLADGNRIIAMLDLTYDGLPVNDVEEIGGNETGNNVAGYTVQVDLVATAVEVYKLPGSGDTVARVSYVNNSPGAVEPFFIRIGVDRDGDKIIDAASLLETIDLSAQPADKVRPGARDVVTGDLTTALNALAVPLQNGDHIIATLDILDDGAGTPENLVGEAEEQTNNFAREPVTVDLVAQTIFLTVDNTAGTTAATVSYTVNSIGKVAAFKLRIGIDRDGDNKIDTVSPADVLLETTLSTLADLTPGPHVFEAANIRPALNALVPQIKNGDRIIGTLDLTLPGVDEGGVDEVTEVGNNVTSLAGTQDQIVDISGDELNLNVGSFIVTFNYTVTSPGDVAPFRIHIGRDTDNDDVIDDMLADLPGDQTPGPHQVSQNVAAQLLALGVASGETVKIVAFADALNDVVELAENNNKLTGSAEYRVDLFIRRISHPCAVLDNAFDATVEYTVLYNQPGENFTICAFASDDDAAAINPGDILLGCLNVTAPADKTVGDHTLVLTGLTVPSIIFPTNNFFVKVRLDNGAAVDESNETNNTLARPNAAMDPSEDSDGDGVPDCFDGCPSDSAKTSPGACGCGVPDTDSDGDGVPDCLDNCPADPNKLDPGICGCGVVDDITDTDGDGFPDCADPAPLDPNLPVPQGGPQGQPVPGGNTGLQVFWPIIPPSPIPVCGVGVCGAGAMVPIGMLIVSVIGLKAQYRRRRNRR